MLRKTSILLIVVLTAIIIASCNIYSTDTSIVNGLEIASVNELQNDPSSIDEELLLDIEMALRKLKKTVASGEIREKDYEDVQEILIELEQYVKENNKKLNRFLQKNHYSELASDINALELLTSDYTDDQFILQILALIKQLDKDIKSYIEGMEHPVLEIRGQSIVIMDRILDFLHVPILEREVDTYIIVEQSSEFTELQDESVLNIYVEHEETYGE